LKIMNEERI